MDAKAASGSRWWGWGGWSQEKVWLGLLPESVAGRHALRTEGLWGGDTAWLLQLRPPKTGLWLETESKRTPPSVLRDRTLKEPELGVTGHKHGPRRHGDRVTGTTVR